VVDGREEKGHHQVSGVADDVDDEDNT